MKLRGFGVPNLAIMVLLGLFVRVTSQSCKRPRQTLRLKWIWAPWKWTSSVTMSHLLRTILRRRGHPSRSWRLKQPLQGSEARWMWLWNRRHSDGPCIRVCRRTFSSLSWSRTSGNQRSFQLEPPLASCALASSQRKWTVLCVLNQIAMPILYFKICYALP